MGLADSTIPVCISNIAQKTCYNSGYGITLYDEVHVHE